MHLLQAILSDIKEVIAGHYIPDGRVCDDCKKAPATKFITKDLMVCKCCHKALKKW